MNPLTWLPEISSVVPSYYFPARLRWFRLDLVVGRQDNRFLVPWTWFCGCLVKVNGCLDSFPCTAWTLFHGCLDYPPVAWTWFVPWFPREGSWLPRSTTLFPGLGTMVAWWWLLVPRFGFLLPWWRFLIVCIRLLDPWTWFHGYLDLVPGLCLPRFALLCLELSWHWVFWPFSCAGSW